jgi:hypothetical protein
MQRRNRIGTARKLEPENGHEELFLVVRGTLATKAHQLVMRNAQFFAQGA